MLHAYLTDGQGLRPTPHPESLVDAIWIDLCRPADHEIAHLEILGVQVPTLADMEEIEISNRIYREGSSDVMTVVIPGQTPSREQTAGPVAFILSRERLVTVRHHTPRPFETFPERAAKSAAGCSSPQSLFLGLAEEIVSRFADLLESVGRALDDTAKGIFDGSVTKRPAMLQRALERIGREGEVLARVRLGLLTMERALSFFGQGLGERPEAERLRSLVKGEMRDLQALAVHADFLSSRLGATTEATLGMINLAQNATVRIVSVVAALFLPPTLIASIYGMNFVHMPELEWRLGYPMALGLIVGSAVVTWAYFKWRHWL